MKFEIIDFHTHPFLNNESNICSYKEALNTSYEDTLTILSELNVSYFCGSVIRDGVGDDKALLEKMLKNNNEALILKEAYKGKYIPGFHIHPRFIKESCEEIERMNKLGVKLIGELVPYYDGWEDYSSKAMSEILDVAEDYDMIVSFHSMGEYEMDVMVKNHPKLKFVAAHPGEKDCVLRHIERAGLNENYYIDLSGYGLHRFGMIRYLIDKLGSDRILFGSDYPTCSPAAFIGGILLDNTLKDFEKEKIFALNARMLLNMD